MPCFQKTVVVEFDAFQFNTVHAEQDEVHQSYLQQDLLEAQLPSFDLYDASYIELKKFIPAENAKSEFERFNNGVWNHYMGLRVTLRWYDRDGERSNIQYEMAETDWLVEDRKGEGGYVVMTDAEFQKMVAA